MKFILSYVNPKRINKKYIIIETETFTELSKIKPNNIDQYYFSTYECHFEEFHPSTNNKAIINMNGSKDANTMEKLIHNKDKYIYYNDEYIMKRESGKTPNGNELNFKWVLRDSCTNEFIDFDTYRHNLAERNGLKI